MTTSTNKVEIKVERSIPAPPGEVFDAWLDPEVPGSLWHEHDKLIFNPKVDGLWYLLTLVHGRNSTPHYGRFVELNRPRLIQHSWVSPHTLGEESIVTVRFKKKEEGTRLILLHSGLPNEAAASAHAKGWNSILDKFSSICVTGSHRRK
jgi:uncharacterized protein YndB with AHSA1/START domain